MNINKNVCKTRYPIESVGFHSRISEDYFFLQHLQIVRSFRPYIISSGKLYMAVLKSSFILILNNKTTENSNTARKKLLKVLTEAIGKKTPEGRQK